MLLKIRAANMITMVQNNDSIARAGSKELSLMRLKELGGQAEHEARELFEAVEDNKNSMDQVMVPTQTDAITSDNQSPARVPRVLRNSGVRSSSAGTTSQVWNLNVTACSTVFWIS
jgi:hypothetical protein